MPLVDDPDGFEFQLPLVITELRQDAGLTQPQVAHALDWSVTKQTRIENAQVAIQVTDLRAMLQLFRVTDAERINELLDLARAELRFRRAYPPMIVKQMTVAIEAADDAKVAEVKKVLEMLPAECPYRIVRIADVRRYA